MKKILIALLSCSLVLLNGCSSSLKQPPSNELERQDLGYVLGSGDTISVNVFQETGLSVRVQLYQGGVLNFPYIGVVTCIGRTPAQIETDISTRLKDGFINEPIVVVTVDKFRSYFIGGEVENPNGYEFKPGLTVEKAIAMAGGITDRGDDDAVNIRLEASGELIENVALTYPVSPGDMITIEQSFF